MKLPMQHALDLAAPATTANLPFADYTYPAKWNGLVLVGEAPGAEEARLGRPFVGRSGQLLDKLLAATGIARAECLVANVFRYRPPDNKIAHFFTSRRAALAQKIGMAEQYGKFGSAFCRADYAPEIDHLAAMLAEKRPKAVVALGRTPLWALTGENGVMEMAGRHLPCRLCKGIEVIATFHPSFILRGNWKLQDEWQRHFQEAADIIK